MKPPFPWFGGKSRVWHLVWQRFGDVDNYVEPFAGSLAVLLNRPSPPRTETANDEDSYLANFWRALQQAPDEVAHYADWPVNEADLHARHRWLLDRADFRQRMHTDPDYYDAKIAGWWVWGLCSWIGSGWCAEDFYAGNESQQLPHLGNPGRGVHRPSQKLPHLGGPGQGVHRPSQQLPHLGGGYSHLQGIQRETNLYAYMRALAARLRGVRVCCGDWQRVLGPSVTFKHGLTGVFLDPPYSAEADRYETLYSVDDLSIAHDVRAWAVANGDNPLLRIALCGYTGEHDDDMTYAGWTHVHWKAAGGYGSQAKGNSRGKANSHREVIWFSPHCLKTTLFELEHHEAD